MSLTKKRPVPLPKGQAQLTADTDRLARSLSRDKRGKTWFIALSGGPDSLALSYVLAKLAPQHTASVTALIVDHRLRANATEEAEFAARTAQKMGLEAQILTVTAQPPETGLAAWARAQRYQLLLSHVRAQRGVIWLAHHGDDQAETVAMRLAHYSGLAGLSAMKEISYRAFVPLLRPALAYPKQLFYEICQAHQLPFIEDPTNQNEDYERVRWRRFFEVTPQAKQECQRLQHFAQRLTSVKERSVQDWVRQHEVCAAHPLQSLWMCLPLTAFEALSPAEQRHVMSYAIHHIGRTPYPPSPQAIDRANKRLNQTGHATISYSLWRKEGDRLLILPESGRPRPLPKLSAGDEFIFEDRLYLRSASPGQLVALDDAVWASLPLDHPLRLALTGAPAEVRRIFVALHPLDERGRNTHIKGTVTRDGVLQEDWPEEGLALYPIGRLLETPS